MSDPHSPSHHFGNLGAFRWFRDGCPQQFKGFFDDVAYLDRSALLKG